MLLLNKLLMLLFDGLYDKLRYDGNFFVRNLDTSVVQSTKRGKRLHRTQYIQYCTWAHALMVRTDCCGALALHRFPILWKVSMQKCKRSDCFVLFPSEKRSWARRCGLFISKSCFEIHKKHHSRRREGRDQRGLSVCVNTHTFLSFLRNKNPLLKLCWSHNN